MIQFLKKCIQVEETAALIYHTFAQNRLCDKALVEIWEKMARDEEDHANQLKLASRLPIRETFEGVREKAPEPDALLGLAKEILERAKAPDQSLLEMLKDAVTLEKDFRKIHASYALEFKDPTLLETFRLLARADTEHLRALDAYLKRYKEEHKLG